VGLPGGLTTALVTAILAFDRPATSRGWFVVVPAATLLTKDGPPALRIAPATGDTDDGANDELTVTGHCNKRRKRLRSAPIINVDYLTMPGRLASLRFAIWARSAPGPDLEDQDLYLLGNLESESIGCAFR
jgi:hypothetical protein